MEILLNSTSNDIYTTSFDTVGKTLTLSGCNNFPLDVYSLREVYDVTHAGYCGLPNSNQFAWFRSNGLPIFVWGLSSIPAAAANGDSLNILLDIPQNQSQLSLQQKQATASAGTPGTLVTGETPGGTINGINTAFTLASAPIKGAVALIYNPLGDVPTFLQYGIDFTMIGSAITMINPPPTGATIFATYYH
jgi:hypothetical protein